MRAEGGERRAAATSARAGGGARSGRSRRTGAASADSQPVSQMLGQRRPVVEHRRARRARARAAARARAPARPAPGTSTRDRNPSRSVVGQPREVYSRSAKRSRAALNHQRRVRAALQAGDDRLQARQRDAAGRRARAAGPLPPARRWRGRADRRPSRPAPRPPAGPAPPTPADRAAAARRPGRCRRPLPPRRAQRHHRLDALPLARQHQLRPSRPAAAARSRATRRR